MWHPCVEVAVFWIGLETALVEGGGGVMNGKARDWIEAEFFVFY